MHRPDSFEENLFTAASRQRAASPSKAEYLTLWEADYPDTESALARIRPAARAFRESGRILPVLDLVFQQFLQRVPGFGHTCDEPVRSLTTLQNDWSRPAAGQNFEAWWKEAVFAKDAPQSGYHSHYAYAAFDLADPDAGKFLVLLESSAQAEQVAQAWEGVGTTSLTSFGPATPIYPEAGAPAQAPGRGDPAPESRQALHIVHWRHESDAFKRA